MAKTMIGSGSRNNDVPKTAAAFRELLMKNEKSGKDGVMTARERITALFDEGTFTETGAYTMRRISEFDGETPDELESVITGYGSVNGCLVYAFAQDMNRTKGSVSEAAAKKICASYKLAVENGCPIVGIFDSAGAYLPEGVRSLAGYASVMKAAASASGIIPQIAIVPGVAQGAAAVIASMFDFVIATENSRISINPPFVVGGGETSDSVESGVVSLTAKTDAEALGAARMLLSYLPSNNEEGGVEVLTNDEVNRLVDTSAYASGDMKALIAAFADDAAYIELGGEYAKSVTTGLVSLCGTVCGIVGTNRAEEEGRLTSKAARKAAKFISFCDCFGIPVITLVDSEGFAVCGDEEKNPYSAEIGRLAGAYAQAKVPLVTLVSGAAYGSVFSVLGSKAIGADIVFALDTAKISPMNAKSAVALLWNDQISKDMSREDLEAKWNETEANVLNAARAGEVDDIIESAEVRQRLASAVMMLSAKAASAPKRRHANLPL
ncbi:MAG: hypothetical protein IJY35_08200 [Clostridia bacterium]|nr:hypothetical protein [Clostridia bacterium]